MTARFTCPRRTEDGTDRADSPFIGAGPDQDRYRRGGYGTFRQKRGCSYCGSMSPDDFLEAVRSGVEIGPTDKSYKLYLDDLDGKFYTQHLSHEQADEFHELRIAGRINWGYPGRPYVPLYLPGFPKAEAGS